MKFRIKRANDRIRVAMFESGTWTDLKSSFSSVSAARSHIQSSAKRLGLLENEYQVKYDKRSLKEGVVRFNARTFTNAKSFSDEAGAIAYVDSNPDWTIVGTIDGTFYVAHNDEKDNVTDTDHESGREDVSNFKKTVDEANDGENDARTVIDFENDDEHKSGSEDVSDFERIVDESEEEDDEAKNESDEEDEDEAKNESEDEDEEKNESETDTDHESGYEDVDDWKDVVQESDKDDEDEDVVAESDKEDDIEVEDADVEVELDESTLNKFVSILGLNESSTGDVRKLVESIVSDKVGVVSKKLNESYHARYKKRQSVFESNLTKKIDRYLAEEVSRWHRANRVPLDKTLKTELAENVVHEMMNVFRRFNVKIPEGKRNLYIESVADRKALKAEVASLKSQLAEAGEEKLSRDKKALVESAVVGLTEMSKGKVERMIGGFKTSDMNEFKNRLEFIVENFASKAPRKKTTTVEATSKKNTINLNEGETADAFADVMRYLA